LTDMSALQEAAKWKTWFLLILSCRISWFCSIFTKHFPVWVKGYVLHRVSVALERAFKVTRFEIP
jgi:hypothetical protein